MCGIVGCRTPGEAGRYLLSALRVLEYRGYDSAGVAVRTTSGTTATLRTVRRVDALAPQLLRWPGPPLGGVGIGHTRWATHGGVTEANAHPHADCSGRISVVHNGIIENADALRAELELGGHIFTSEVDSEVMGHLIETRLLLGDDLVEAVRASVSRLRGSWAFVVMDAETGRVVATVHRSPLVVARSPHGDFVASDVAAIAEWIDDFQPLRDGDIVELGESLLWAGDGTQPASVISHYLPDELRLTGHSDFMGKEIDEQPEVAARILDALTPGIARGTLWNDLGMAPFARVAVLGCGTSLNAGSAIGMAFSRLGGVPWQSIVASEAGSGVIEEGTLVLAISQSGETADVLRAIEYGAPHSALLALTNNTHSTLARAADSVVNCLAGSEVGVAATKTFVAQVLTGVCYAISALVATGRIPVSLARRLRDEMLHVPDLLAQSIAVSKEVVPPLAARFQDSTGFVFLGRGSGVVYAAEGALKLKELTYRWAEAYPAGELKHGPLALVEPGTPVIVVDNADPRLSGNIAEVRARGGRVIRIGGVGSDLPALGRSAAEPLLGGMDRWGPLESVVPMQILARELALVLGRDVDKPRNLAKSVTVE